MISEAKSINAEAPLLRIIYFIGKKEKGGLYEQERNH